MQVLDWRRSSLMAIGIVLVVGTSAIAQTGLADIRGTVVDDSGAALPGVTVTATHVDTGASRTTVTSATGVFLMPALQVGKYRLQLELAGFNTVIQDNLLLEVGQSATLSFTMKIATLQETVTVAGESPLVETSKSDLAGRVSATQVENLPLNGRNWLDLVALVPGARGNPGTIRAGFAGGDMARYQVDGVDVSGQCCGGVESGLQPGEHPGIRGHHQPLRRRVRPRRRRGDQRRHQVRHEPASWQRALDSCATAIWATRKNFITNKVETFHEKQMGLNGGGPILRDQRLLLRELRIPGTRCERDSANRLRQPSTCPRTTGSHGTTRRSAVMRSWARSIASVRADVELQLGTAQCGRRRAQRASRTATAGPRRTQICRSATPGW